MNSKTTFGIARRLYLVSLLLVLSLFSLVSVSWTQLSGVADLAQVVGDKRASQLQQIDNIELNVTRVALQLRHAMLVKTAADRAATLADIDARHRQIDTDLAEFQRGAFNSEGRDAFEKIAASGGELRAVESPNIKLIEAGDNAGAFDMLVVKTIPARNRLLSVLDVEKKRQAVALNAELDSITASAIRTRNEMVGVAAAIAIGLIAFGVSIGRLLTRRVAEAQAVADRVRDGDLTVSIVDGARDEFSPLLNALRDMQASLTRVVGDVREHSDAVATASAQIAQGNNDLSQRTEKQASALEETAASMEELSSTVKQNAENARQANQLAASASTVAVQGGQVVSQVVTTMKGINDSSKKIADIISVIDGIAFQTNILALNAAVEAARAGEQGRGFAVVASEVRSLAGRSADAAKEIKSLITASVERVEQGTALVDQAGATMTEVVNSIKRVTDIMGEISAASSEQSAGVAQVGEAVNQMDQATQQNAALVEESAAAAESLRTQAQALVQTVAVFTLAHDGQQRVASAANASQAERRGPGRAMNVTRPAFTNTRRANVPTPHIASASSVAAANGTDGWESF